jgi:hypothetical protein
MYPREDLIGFARQKAALRQSIALNRERCAKASARAAQPIEFVDNVRTFWRQLSPVVKVAALPLGVAVTRALFPRYRFLRRILRWAPLAFAAARAVSAAGAGGGAGRPASKEYSQATQFETR